MCSNLRELHSQRDSVAGMWPRFQLVLVSLTFPSRCVDTLLAAEAAVLLMLRPHAKQERHAQQLLVDHVQVLDALHIDLAEKHRKACMLYLNN